MASLLGNTVGIATNLCSKDDRDTEKFLDHHLCSLMFCGGLFSSYFSLTPEFLESGELMLMVWVYPVHPS